MREQLLAKSTFRGQNKTLLEHTQDVVQCVISLFGTSAVPTRLGGKFAAMFGVADVGRFLDNLIAAAVLHDIGKANDEFLTAIEYANRKPRALYKQAIRHEHVSAALLMTDFGQPLRNSPAHDGDIVIAAVVGHHRKTDWECLFECRLKLETAHEEFVAIVKFANQVTGLDWTQSLPTNGFDVDELEQLLGEDLDYLLSNVELGCGRDRDFASMSHAVSAGLIIADTAGSALVRQQKPLTQWIEEVFQPDNVFDSRYVFDSIIQPRIDQLCLRENGVPQRDFEWSKFQLAADELSARSLLIAPCGSGKTMAAWRWLAAQAKARIRHAIFLYPTRATATEGFRDYVSWAPESDAALMHGSAAYELQSMFRNPAVEIGNSRANRDFVPEQAKSLRSLAFWDKRFFSATVDQFLAFLQWDYSSLCLLPVLADGAVVVDEVHSFDDKMFDALNHFLERMNVPVLCMTATLPKVRREALEGRLETLDAFTAEEFEDLRLVDSEPRYEMASGDRDTAVSLALAAFNKRQKVLWVVNTVDRAQQLYRELQQLGIDQGLFCYHSRFRLDDRKDRHGDVVKAFQSHSQERAFAITTQVCEMGLDLDADVLVTEQCPASSLIQRMGRCNRSMKPRQTAGHVFIYQPVCSLPYDDNDLSGIEELIETASATERISQSALNLILLGLKERDADPQPLPSFFCGGFINVGSYRDIEEHTKQAILENEINDAIGNLNTGKPIDGFLLPVPRYSPTQNATPPLPRWLQIASEKNYCSEVGYQRTVEADNAATNASNLKEDVQWMIM